LLPFARSFANANAIAIAFPDNHAPALILPWLCRQRTNGRDITAGAVVQDGAGRSGPCNPV
jgi:hypothetical protein